MNSLWRIAAQPAKNAEIPVFQTRHVASRDIRIRAYLAGEVKSSYIITRQFFSPSAMRWVNEPISY